MIPPYDEQNWWQRMIVDAVYAVLFVVVCIPVMAMAGLIDACRWLLKKEG